MAISAWAPVILPVRASPRARPNDHRLSPREALERKADLRRGQRSGGLPIAAFEGKAHWDCRNRIGHRKVRVVAFVEAHQFADDLFGLMILGCLQIGVFHVIHRVDGFAVISTRPEALADIGKRRGIGRAVRIDRFLPHTETGEDVRGHVQGMRHVGRNLGVADRRVETGLSQLGRIVAMDQVMHNAGVVRLFLPHLV